MKKSPTLLSDLLLSLAAGLIFGAGMAAFQPPPYFTAFLSTSLLLWLTFFLGMRTWRFFKGGRRLAILLLVTFFMRVLLGVFLHQSLPQIGFDTEVQNAGYVYSDAHQRDTQAFALASGPDSLFSAFSGAQKSDQYGGLLFLSALVYRVLSPDTARPLLITLLGALSMALGLAFLYAGVKERWGERVALVSAWFLALYPEGVLLGSSQMREPFLIGLFCLGLWAVLGWRKSPRSRIIVFILAMLAALAFSIPMGLLISAALVCLALVDWLSTQTSKRNKLLGWGILAVFVGVILFAGWMWLKPNLYYDAYLTESSSGLIAMLVKQIGKKWSILFITGYGLAQPVLPAALTDVSLPVWMAIAIYRGLGWYFAIPFLIYGAIALWRVKPAAEKWIPVFLLLAMLIWSGVSSARAGGDQWDNPRYRAIFLPMLSVLVGWLAVYAKENHSKWLKRIFIIVITGVLLFTLWYLPRRGAWGIALSFFDTILLVSGVTLLLVVIWVVLDHLSRKAIKNQKI